MENNEEIKNTKRQIALPILLALALAVGFYFGARVATPMTPNSELGIKATHKFNKLNDILSYIEHEWCKI